MLSGRWTLTAASDIPVCHSNFLPSLAKVVFSLHSVCLLKAQKINVISSCGGGGAGKVA